jgi:hypothetical protein
VDQRVAVLAVSRLRAAHVLRIDLSTVVWKHFVSVSLLGASEGTLRHVVVRVYNEACLKGNARAGVVETHFNLLKLHFDSLLLCKHDVH